MGGIAEGRGGDTSEQRTLDAKAALTWIRKMRESKERGSVPPLKYLAFQKRADYEQVRCRHGGDANSIRRSGHFLCIPLAQAAFT